MSELISAVRECDGGCGRTVHGYIERPTDRLLCGACAEWERAVGEVPPDDEA